MERRQFLIRTGLGLGAGAIGAGALSASGERPPTAADAVDWRLVRDQFALSRDYVHLASFFLASHPAPVRDAIERHRRGLDENPYGYFLANVERGEVDILRTAAAYIGGRPEEVAITDSTTTGLGLLYGQIRLREGQEILTTTHDHYSTDESLRYRAERTGATVRRVALYGDSAHATAGGMVDAIVRAVTPKTRVVAVTWVHSGTGVKLPVRQIADALARANANRDDEDRALLCVDGVHGFGNQETPVAELGCDFLIAGCHKWIFGPRGTGLVWGREEAWRAAYPTIPTFDIRALLMWEGDIPKAELPMAARMSPGGFRAFEHRWALAEAFRFHESLGKRAVHERVRALNAQFKEGVAKMGHVRLRTPVADEASGGIVCFEVDGLASQQVVERLLASRILTSVAPYATKYARASFNVFNTPDEVETTLAAIAGLR
jgi:selenocysteine lyase/cysteine desulfurase